MPKSVLNCSLVATVGKYTYDPTTKILLWDIGKVETGKPPNLKGSVSFVSHFNSLQSDVEYVQFQLTLQSGGEAPESNPTINVCL